jgi:hypothetical protein
MLNGKPTVQRRPLPPSSDTEKRIQRKIGNTIVRKQEHHIRQRGERLNG